MDAVWEETIKDWQMFQRKLVITQKCSLKSLRKSTVIETLINYQSFIL
jgi:hypothetical protein